MSIDIHSVVPRNDNVLIQLEVHADPHEERLSPGGIILPKMRDVNEEPAIIATVVAAGPGYYADEWLDHEQGTAPVGTRHPMIPLDPAIVPGARVILSKAGLAADRVWSDDVREYRMCRAHCIEAVLEDE